MLTGHLSWSNLWISVYLKNKTRKPGYVGPKFQSPYPNINFPEFPEKKQETEQIDFPEILVYFH